MCLQSLNVKLLCLAYAGSQRSVGFRSDQSFKATKESDFLEIQSTDLVKLVLASWKFGNFVFAVRLGCNASQKLINQCTLQQDKAKKEISFLFLICLPGLDHHYKIPK